MNILIKDMKEQLSKLKIENMRATLKMLLQEFIVCIAIPMRYYFMDNWFQSYNYRTDIPAWILLVTRIGAFAITILTVSFQGLKTAIANPVDAIKSE